jgi:AbrB family looped-hinge helix DNA binding protein
MITNAKISDKGWVVIPSELRRKYDLNPGTQVKIIDYGGVLAIVPVKPKAIEESAGMLAGYGSLTAALLASHHKDLEHEGKR